MRPECQNLPAGRRSICNGDTNLPLFKINQYRESWGLPPLEMADLPQVEPAATATVRKVNLSKGSLSFEESLGLLPCKHRGEVIGKIQCSCGTKPPIYDCPVRGPCVAMREGGNKRAAIEKAGVAICSECQERTLPGEEKPVGPPPPRQRRSQTRSASGRFPVRGNDQRWITLRDEMDDAVRLMQKLPSDLDAVAGVSRSGMGAAWAIAMLLHLPLLAYDPARGLVELGNGWRLGEAAKKKRQKVAVIDDHTLTGGSIGQVRDKMRKAHPDIEAVICCLYHNPEARHGPDIYVELLPQPHRMEANLLNGVYSPMCGLDFHGVISEDPRPDQDDDGPKFLEFCHNAKPLYLPRKEPVKAIVTWTLEKYRPQMEDWLRRHRVRWHRLIMAPWTTKAERAKQSVAGWKAHEIRASGVEFYVESDPRIAKEIAGLIGLPVFCVQNGVMY